MTLKYKTITIREIISATDEILDDKEQSYWKDILDERLVPIQELLDMQEESTALQSLYNALYNLHQEVINELEKMENEIETLKETNYDFFYANAFLEIDKTDLENKIDKAKKEVDDLISHCEHGYMLDERSLTKLLKVLNK
jgi:hypothetical protein